MTTESTNIVAGAIPKNYDVLRFWKDGCLLLGASDLTGRLWNGAVCHFRSADRAPDLEHCTAAKEVDTGVCDAVTLPMLDERCYKAVIGCDYGGIELLELVYDEAGVGAPVFANTACCCEHDDAVVSVTLSSDSEKVASGSMDKSIKIWDLASWTATHTYSGAHYGIINMVAYHPEMPDIFASCSRDGRVVMWDSRLARPATVIDRGPVSAVPTAVAWQPGQDARLLIGDELGGVMITDVRGCNGKINHVNTNEKAIFRFEFQPWCGQKVSICADETTISVMNIHDDYLDTIYKDSESHSDFVRGIAWHPTSQLLYSCGWDSTVKSHTITAMENGSS